MAALGGCPLAARAFPSTPETTAALFLNSRMNFFEVQVLTLDQQERYARHLMLEDVGEEGQKKLVNGSVLVVGAGGLGSPALFYLVAAGIGRVGAVDCDRVELSNLQRQILHSTGKIGT